MSNHLGLIKINQELILSWLDYTEGIIRGIRLDDNLRDVEVIIEHEDMPEVQELLPIPVVTPVYITYQDAFGHRVTLRDRNDNK